MDEELEDIIDDIDKARIIEGIYFANWLAVIEEIEDNYNYPKEEVLKAVKKYYNIK